MTTAGSTTAGSKMWWRHLAGLGAAAILMLAGCASAYRAALDNLEATKPASLSGWTTAEIDGQNAEDWLWDRSAIIVGGAEDFTAVFNPDRTRMQRTSLGDEKADAGSAVAVTPDGYFLTAAHCVEKAPLWIVLRTEDNQPQRYPARVVWVGDESSGGPDLALIHIDASTPKYLEIHDDPFVPKQVLCCGSGIGSLRWCAGRGVSVGGGIYRGVPCTVTVHTSPVSLGDSGGPAVDAAGVFIGVNIEVEVQLDGTDAHATAIRPGSQWLRDRIAEDRTKH
ncbi:MAG: S1 family peptidase [Phycisphaerales bacterium]